MHQIYAKINKKHPLFYLFQLFLKKSFPKAKIRNKIYKKILTIPGIQFFCYFDCKKHCEYIFSNFPMFTLFTTQLHLKRRYQGNPQNQCTSHINIPPQKLFFSQSEKNTWFPPKFSSSFVNLTVILFSDLVLVQNPIALHHIDTKTLFRLQVNKSQTKFIYTQFFVMVFI